MSTKGGVRKRPTKHQRPKRKYDSTILDPNASSCPLCEEKDTVEMIECEKCKNRYHFRCAKVNVELIGADASMSAFRWNCKGCTNAAKPKPIIAEETKGSIRSSMSSRRRSMLQLEMLQREKEIQDNLIV